MISTKYLNICKILSLQIYLTDAPSGKPVLEPTVVERHENEIILLICETDLKVYGKPECYSFRWFKVGDNGEEYPRQTQNRTLEIIVNKTSEGKYMCLCENLFGQSALSDPSQVFLSKTRTSLSLLIV